MINKKEVITRHNPKLHQIEHESFLSVGNGEFAFNSDITGMQSISEDYEQQEVPLCTMSQWGWHSTPSFEQPYTYSFEDVKLTPYRHGERDVYYAVREQEGNEPVYNWLRKNPHKFNLGRIGLLWNNRPLQPSQLSSIKQELVLYEGKIISTFKIEETPCRVITVAGQDQDSVSFSIESDGFTTGELSISLSFPYGSHKKSASDWESDDRHDSILEKTDDGYSIKRTMDTTTYWCKVKADEAAGLNQVDTHVFNLASDQSEMTFSVLFTQQEKESVNSFEENHDSSVNKWKAFWEKGGLIDFSKSQDTRAKELERRMVLSLYLIAIQGTGSLPPQETGLSMNSWYGKFHLEMHLWHNAFLPLWGHEELLMPSLRWYKDHLNEARENARRNGYHGARWPKMIGYDAVDSPSTIATLLIWQQTHIIYMLELVYKVTENSDMLDEFFDVVEETADFVCDFLVYEEASDTYNLTGPIMPSQEVYDPEKVRNPAFELEYWRFTLGLAINWANRKNVEKKEWERIYKQMAGPPVENDLYIGHENAANMFETYNHDHPSMTGMYGLIPSDRIDKRIMNRTIDKIREVWEMDTLWGWDFAMMAMTSTRLHDPMQATDLLMMDASKNYYAKNGHNYQKTRTDLPVYLPGNGSLLLALSLMTAGTKSNERFSGFPQDSQWELEYSDIQPFPY